MSDCFDSGTGLRSTLRHNLGRVCTLFTDSGDSFTGVLSEVDANSIKLITLHHGRDDERLRNGECGEGVRRVHTIPIDKIDCLATSQF